jgi:hypothetical protein
MLPDPLHLHFGFHKVLKSNFRILPCREPVAWVLPGQPVAVVQVPTVVQSTAGADHMECIESSIRSMIVQKQLDMIHSIR